MVSTVRKINVKCPKCTTEFSYYESNFRPFCSEKCKLIDLGRWLSEEYTVEGRENSVYIEDEEMLQRLIDDTNENY